MKLTDNKQIEILTKLLFTTPDSPPGLTDISRKLLMEGSCIVTGDGKLWGGKGGVGNFISVTPAAGTVGCSLLRLDAVALLRSMWAINTLSSHHKPLLANYKALEQELFGLAALLRLGKDLWE